MIFLRKLDERREKALSYAGIDGQHGKPEWWKQPVVQSAKPSKAPEDLKVIHCLELSLQTVQPYINRQMLIGHHLGLKGKVAKMIKEGNEKAIS